MTFRMVPSTLCRTAAVTGRRRFASQSFAAARGEERHGGGLSPFAALAPCGSEPRYDQSDAATAGGMIEMRRVAARQPRGR